MTEKELIVYYKEQIEWYKRQMEWSDQHLLYLKQRNKKIEKMRYG